MEEVQRTKITDICRRRKRDECPGCQICRLLSCPLARPESRKMILLGSSWRSTLDSLETLEGQSSTSSTLYDIILSSTSYMPNMGSCCSYHDPSTSPPASAPGKQVVYMLTQVRSSVTIRVGWLQKPEAESVTPLGGLSLC